MIKISGVEYGLFWSIKAHCDFDDWLLKNRNSSYTRGIVKKAVLANEAFRTANKIKEPVLTEELINGLPNKEYNDLKTAVEKQILEDSGITVEQEEPEGKNAEGSAESN